MLDRSVALLDLLAAGPLTLPQLVAGSGLPKPTVHRLVRALCHHALVTRDGRAFRLGPGFTRLAAGPAADPLPAAAAAVLPRLRDLTGESAQLYVPAGEHRVCLAAAERAAGLRDTVPVGSVLPMTAGSAAQVLLAWRPPEEIGVLLRGARFDAATLATVRRQGWAQSVAEREAGVASVSAPVRSTGGTVVAAVSVSGPIERFGRSPGRRHATPVVNAAAEVSDLIG